MQNITLIFPGNRKLVVAVNGMPSSLEEFPIKDPTGGFERSIKAHVNGRVLGPALHDLMWNSGIHCDGHMRVLWVVSSEIPGIDLSYGGDLDLSPPLRSEPMNFGCSLVQLDGRWSWLEPVVETGQPLF